MKQQSNNQIKLKGIFLLFFFFVLGFLIIYKVSNKILADREVASIGQIKINNLNLLNSSDFKKDLLSKIKIYSISNEKNGNEKIIALEGFSSQLCKSFSKIDLFFDAYGVSVSGEPTQLKISTFCTAGQDPAEIALIKIPFEKILNEKARNAEFKFSGYLESFELINSDHIWAKTWILNKLVFRSETESKLVKIDRSSNEQPIVLEF